MFRSGSLAEAVAGGVVRDLLPVAHDDQPVAVGVRLDDLRAPDGEAARDVGPAVDAAPVVDAEELGADLHLGVRGPVLLGAVVDARAAVLVGQPAPGALDRRGGLDGQGALDGRPVVDVPVELDLDRRGDPDRAVVADVQDAPQLARGGDGVEGALQRRRVAVFAGGGTRPRVVRPVGQAPRRGPARPVVRQGALDGLALGVTQSDVVQGAVRDADRDGGSRVDACRPGGRVVGERRCGLRRRRGDQVRRPGREGDGADSDSKQSDNDDREDDPGPPPHDNSPREPLM